MNVLVQPSPSTVWKFTTTVASAGTSSVAMNSRNSTRLPGNSRIANAYAASTDVTTWNTVTITATTSELSEIPPEMARRPRLAEHVEREGGRQERVVEHLVAGLQRRDHRGVDREQDDHRQRGEQPVAGRRGASRPARRTHERRCAGRGRSASSAALSGLESLGGEVNRHSAPAVRCRRAGGPTMRAAGGTAAPPSRPADRRRCGSVSSGRR